MCSCLLHLLEWVRYTISEFNSSKQSTLINRRFLISTPPTSSPSIIPTAVPLEDWKDSKRLHTGAVDGLVTGDSGGNSAYYSRCIPDSASYLTANCIGNYAELTATKPNTDNALELGYVFDFVLKSNYRLSPTFEVSQYAKPSANPIIWPTTSPPLLNLPRASPIFAPTPTPALSYLAWAWDFSTIFIRKICYRSIYHLYWASMSSRRTDIKTSS
eukprot:gene35632-46214_t